jgi:hypothetical protein
LKVKWTISLKQFGWLAIGAGSTWFLKVLIDSIHSRVRGVSEFSAVISSTSIVTGLSFHLN